MRIIKLIKITAGRMHAWYEAEHRGQTFEVRKPRGAVDLLLPDAELAPAQTQTRKTPLYEPESASRTWWQRFVDWILGRGQRLRNIV